MPQQETISLTPEQQLNQIRVQRALNRRNFLARLGAAGAAIAGGSVLAGCGSAGNMDMVQAAGPSEADVLNFALNLEYLEATFYSYVATGADIPSGSTGGGPAPTGAPGAKPAFANQQIADIFSEIYFDELSHVNDLRSALGSAAVARPQLNLGALGTVSTSNYITVARLFEDVGVTAYTGAATLLSSSNLQAAAQILAVEAFHAGALRLVAIQQGQTAYVSSAAKPSDGYDVLPLDPGSSASASGPTSAGGFFATAGASNSTTAQQSSTFPGLAYRRTTSQVLSIVYAASSGSSGGFSPPHRSVWSRTRRCVFLCDGLSPFKNPARLLQTNQSSCLSSA